MRRLIFLLLLIPCLVFAGQGMMPGMGQVMFEATPPSGDSDNFPAYVAAPVITSYVSGGTFNNTYYIATDGNDSTGTGAIGNPWATVNGASSGGAGTAVAAGDLVYFRGGTYVATETNPQWTRGYYSLDPDGTSEEHIVLAAYPAETPTFTSTTQDSVAILVTGDYVVTDGLTFTTSLIAYGDYEENGGQYGVIQNCTFDGHPVKGDDGQLNASHLYVLDGANNVTVRNNYFESDNAHAIKSYTSQYMPDDLLIEYNVFVGGNVSYGLINFKSAITNFEIRYNRFESITSTEVIATGPSYTGEHNGLLIHHNVFDDCRETIVYKQGSASSGQVLNLDFYSNVILNGASGTRVVLELDCDEGGCLSGADESLGEFYDNAYFDEVTMIEPEETSDFTNYPDYFNYNAYPSTAIRDTAVNENSLASSFWQGSALIQASHGITRTGSSGNYFYTIESDNGLVGAGRYGGNIGGFVF